MILDQDPDVKGPWVRAGPAKNIRAPYIADLFLSAFDNFGTDKFPTKIGKEFAISWIREDPMFGSSDDYLEDRIKRRRGPTSNFPRNGFELGYFERAKRDEQSFWYRCIPGAMKTLRESFTSS